MSTLTLNLPVQQTTADGSISGAIDGSNRTYVLSGVQQKGMDLFWNGLMLTNGIDYSITNNTLTMLTATAPAVSDILSARVWIQ